MYYLNTDGQICDKDLWDEILGADDQDVIQIGGIEPPPSGASSISSLGIH